MACIVLASRKGGVGKTTTAIALAVMYARHGYRTGVLELDKNQPIADFAGIQKENGIHERNLHFLDPFDPKQGLLKRELIDREREHDVLIVDLPGVADDAMLHAAAVADLVLIPTATTRWDADQALQTWNDMMVIVEGVKHPPAIRVLLTQTPASSTAIPKTYKEIVSIFNRMEVPRMRVEMTRRQPWIELQAGGTFPERDPKNPSRTNAYENALSLYKNTLEYLVAEPVEA